jgi:hypothetical protein
MDRRTLLGAGLACLAVARAASQPFAPAGVPRRAFVGRLLTEWLTGSDGMRLIEPFAYVDASGQPWIVPDGAEVNGASIPKPFWGFIGHPYMEPYRRAAVIHDFYCDVRLRPWQSVHRMFHEAMLAAGVEERLARLMFLGVFTGGPRWNFQVSRNTARLAPGADICRIKPPGEIECRVETPDHRGSGGVASRPRPIEPVSDLPLPALRPDQLDALIQAVKTKDLTLDEIENMVRDAELDAQLQNATAATAAEAAAPPP